MAKREKSKPQTSGQSVELSHNPFAKLSGLSAPNVAPEKDAVAVSSPAQPVDARFPNKLVVRMEKKGRRGKTVTRISGIPTAELKALTKEIKKALGCGATIEGDDLLLLGSLVDRGAAWLESQGATRIVKGN